MRRELPLLAASALLLAGGCGGAKHAAAPTPTQPTSTSTTRAPTTTRTTGAGPLQAEAQSAAAGDIPDNQVFLVFHDRAARYSMKYPEGWAETGAGDRITFRDKNNIVRVVVSTGLRPSAAQVREQLSRLAGAQVAQAPSPVTIAGRRAIKAVYTTVSVPNVVTGKRVRLVVDRYYVGGSGKVAIVDLGTPQGVDNVDAYRLMIESFRWR